MQYIIIILLAIAADQVSKYFAVENLQGSSIPLINQVLHFTYTENSGAAFSILKDKKIVLLILSSFGILIVLWYLISLMKLEGKCMLKTALALVIAGGVGNIIDRARLGYVVDFIDFRLINFPIFNVADIFVVIGCILLIIDTFFVSKTLKNL